MRKYRTGWLCLVLGLLTLALYAPAVRNDFVNYDDPDYVTSNPHVQAGLTLANVKWALTTGEASNWHPLTWLSHCLDYQLFGDQPAGHHATSVILHAVNAILVFLVLRRLTGAFWLGAFAAAVFAWHPLQVESVAWISERKNVLSTLFWWLTMGCYAAYVTAGQRKTGKAGLYYALALGCFAVGLLAKPMLVTLPCVLLLLDFWPLRRGILPFVKESGSAPEAATAVPWSRLVLEKIPFLLLAVVSSVVTFWVQRTGGAVSSLNSLSLGARLANAVVSYCRYVGKLFWPTDLSVLYPHPGHWPVGAIVAAMLFLLVVTALVVWQLRERPYLAVGWFWFLGTLVPVIGLIQVGVQSMADRYMYVPITGLLLMLTWGAADWLGRQPAARSATAMGAGVGLGLCVLLTMGQIRYWRNSQDLFRHAVVVTRDNYLAYNNLGYFLDHEGQVDEALTNYQKSIAINPNYDEAQNNLGYALAAKGRYAEAVGYYENALRLKPTLAEAHNNLGNALADLGRHSEAIEHYRIAQRLKPAYSDAHANYGIALAMQGKLDEAVVELTEAARLDPEKHSHHSNLGNALALQHKLDAAAAEFALALRLKPGDAQAHNNLGNVLAEQGKLNEAGAEYAEALRLKPENPEAQFNYAVVLIRQDRRDEALLHFRETLRLNPNHAVAQRQVAALTGGKP